MLGKGRKAGDEHIWDELLKDVDKDGNGEIDFDEFKEMMTRFLQQAGTEW